MTRLRTLTMVVAVGLALALSACGDSASTASTPLPTWYPGGNATILAPTDQGTGAATPTAAATPTPAAVGVGQPTGLGTPASSVAATADLKFSPASITVKVGDVIQWTNTSSVPHNVTFDGDDALTSATLQQGDTWQVKFSVAGTYSYHCTFHPGMDGKVTVTG